MLVTLGRVEEFNADEIFSECLEYAFIPVVSSEQFKISRQSRVKFLIFKEKQGFQTFRGVDLFSSLSLCRC